MHQPFLPISLAAWPGSLNVTPYLCLYSEDCGDSRRQTRGSARVLSLRGSKSAVLWGGHSCLLTTNIEGLSPFYDWKRHQSFFVFGKHLLIRNQQQEETFFRFISARGQVIRLFADQGWAKRVLLVRCLLWADVLRLHTWSYFVPPACPMLVGEAGSLQTSIRAAP